MDVQVVERVKAKELRKLENSKKIEYPGGHAKRQILTRVLENGKKSAVKHSIEKTIFLNFLHLSTIPVQDCTSKFAKLVAWNDTENLQPI